MNEKIALIIINYNSWEHTINCLQSIENVKSKTEIKVFLIDNGSNNDSSQKITSHLSKQKLNVDFTESDTNRGFSGGNNIGIRKAIEENFNYFMILNNDTILTHDIFEPVISLFQKRPECSVIAAQTIKPNNEREIFCTRARPNLLNLAFLYNTPLWNKEWCPGRKKHYMLAEDLNTPFPIYAGSGACMAFKKEYFDVTGLFDENTFLFLEEFIIGEKCARAELKTYFMPEPTLVHLGGQSTPKSAFSFIEYCKSEAYYCKNYLDYGALPMATIASVRFLKYIYYSATTKDFRENIHSFYSDYLRRVIM